MEGEVEVAVAWEGVVDSGIGAEAGRVFVAGEEGAFFVVEFKDRINGRAGAAGFHFEDEALVELAGDAVVVAVGTLERSVEGDGGGFDEFGGGEGVVGGLGFADLREGANGKEEDIGEAVGVLDADGIDAGRGVCLEFE